MMHRLLTLGPANEPLWVRLCVHRIGEAWVAMIVGDSVPLPLPGEVKGLGLFGGPAAEAEELP